MGSDGQKPLHSSHRSYSEMTAKAAKFGKCRKIFSSSGSGHYQEVFETILEASLLELLSAKSFKESFLGLLKLLK